MLRHKRCGGCHCKAAEGQNIHSFRQGVVIVTVAVHSQNHSLRTVAFQALQSPVKQPRHPAGIYGKGKNQHVSSLAHTGSGAPLGKSPVPNLSSILPHQGSHLFRRSQRQFTAASCGAEKCRVHASVHTAPSTSLAHLQMFQHKKRAGTSGPLFLAVGFFTLPQMRRIVQPHCPAKPHALHPACPETARQG